MARKLHTLVLLYSSLRTERLPLADKESVSMFIEDPDVIDWYFEEDKQNDKNNNDTT